MNIKISSLFLLLTATALLSGCIPQVGNTSTVQKSEYVKGALVTNFPPTMLYKGAKVIESYGFEDKFGGSFVTGDNLSTVYKFYSALLPSLGYETSTDTKSATNYVLNIKNDQQVGSV
ncbi:MAG: hypothetical protein ACHQVK_01185, partial [Candidatus Paceibacterales bacterium]